MKTGENKKIIVDAEDEAEHKHPDNCELLEEADYVDYLFEKAGQTGSKTVIISVDTEEGQQFLTGFGGVGAILRYR